MFQGQPNLDANSNQRHYGKSKGQDHADEVAADPVVAGPVGAVSQHAEILVQQEAEHQGQHTRANEQGIANEVQSDQLHQREQAQQAGQNGEGPAHSPKPGPVPVKRQDGAGNQVSLGKAHDDGQRQELKGHLYRCGEHHQQHHPREQFPAANVERRSLG